MYSIMLKNGKTINIRANNMDWYENSTIIKLLYDNLIVARINMDNVIGLINPDYMMESEEIDESNY